MWIPYLAISIFVFVAATIYDWFEFEELSVGDVVFNIIVSFIPLINVIMLLNIILDYASYLGLKLWDSVWLYKLGVSYRKLMQTPIAKKKPK